MSVRVSVTGSGEVSVRRSGGTWMIAGRGGKAGSVAVTCVGTVTRRRR